MGGRRVCTQRKKTATAPPPSARKKLRLDSVFLHWRLKQKALRQLSASALLDIFRKEARRFSGFTKGKCKKIAKHLRAALLVVVSDPDDQAAIKAESDPSKLRDEWVDLIMVSD